MTYRMINGKHLPLPPVPPHEQATRGQLIAAVGRPALADRPVTLSGTSAAPHHPYPQRYDPFHDHWLWTPPPWLDSPHQVMTVVDSQTGGRQVERHDDFIDIEGRGSPGQVKWGKLLASGHVHRMLALLDGLGHATAEQLAAWIGCDPKNLARYTLPAWEAGLIRRCRFQPAVPGSLPFLYSLNPGKRLKRYMKELDIDARLVFGGRDRASIGSSHVRHNVLATELVLRLLETNPHFVAVGPEHSASPVDLTGHKHAPTAKQLRGDAVIYCADGLRVVIEIVGSAKIRAVEDRMVSWGNWLATQPVQTAGIVVVFVNAVHENHVAFSDRLRKAHTDVFADPTWGGRERSWMFVPAHQKRDAGMQVHLASWMDWFPAHQEASVAAAGCATAYTTGGARWGALDLADPAQYPYKHQGPVTTPPWLLTPEWAGPPTPTMDR